jgi:hypothetical protein
MESVIDRLVGENGYVKVYSYIMSRMKDDFDFMNGVFQSPKMEEITPLPLKEKKPVKKKIQAVVENVSDQPNEKIETVPAQNTTPAPENSQATSGEISLEDNVPEPILSTKQRQKIKQLETRARLDKEGKSITDVLTVENMKMWIAQKKSYAYIGHSEVGCPEKMVSDFAKKHEIESPFNTQRKAIIARKKSTK